MRCLEKITTSLLHLKINDIQRICLLSIGIGDELAITSKERTNMPRGRPKKKVVASPELSGDIQAPETAQEAAKVDDNAMDPKLNQAIGLAIGVSRAWSMREAIVLLADILVKLGSDREVTPLGKKIGNLLSRALDKYEEDLFPPEQKVEAKSTSSQVKETPALAPVATATPGPVAFNAPLPLA